MKKSRPSSATKGNNATRTIERTSKASAFKAIKYNTAASHLVDSKIDTAIKDYLKSSTDSGIVNEVRGKAVAGFYMVNVSLEKRVFHIGSKKKRVPKTKRQRCKVNKSSFDQRSNRGGNELLYI